jgi:ferritin
MPRKPRERAGITLDAKDLKTVQLLKEHLEKQHPMRMNMTDIVRYCLNEKLKQVGLDHGR